MHDLTIGVRKKPRTMTNIYTGKHYASQEADMLTQFQRERERANMVFEPWMLQRAKQARRAKHEYRIARKQKLARLQGQPQHTPS